MARPDRRHKDKAFWASAVACLVVVPGWWQAGAARGQDPARGELRIEGTHITKLVLEGGDAPHTEELTDPNASLTLPVGAYRVQLIELQGGYICPAQSLIGLERIAVMEDTPEVLKVGGPLRQEVTVNRQGRVLVLNYRLLGIGGERYSDTTRNKPPRFTIYKGGVAIASGNFEYG